MSMSMMEERSTSGALDRLRGIAASLASPNALCLLMLVLPALAAAFVVVEAVRYIPVRGDNAWAEAQGIAIAQRWAHGHPLYSDFRLAPYVWTSFLPLWYAIIALADRAGLSSIDTLTLFGRGLTVASLVGLGVTAYRWNRRRGFSVPAALSTPAFYCSMPILIPWAVAARPDFSALLLSFMAVCLAASGAGLVVTGLAGLLAALAFLMKHSALAAPAVIGLWLLWGHRWRGVIVFALVWGLVVGGTLIGFEILSGGLLSFNLRGSHVGEFSLGNIKQVVMRTLGPGQGFTLGLFVLALFGAWQTGRPDRDAGLLRLYFGVAGGLAILVSGFANAGENHFFEAAVAAAMFVPAALTRVSTVRGAQPLAPLALLLALALFLPSLDAQRWRMLGSEPADFHRLVPLVERHRILTDIPYLAARTPSLELLESIALTHKEKAGAWSPQPIIDAVQAGAYDLVVLDRALDDPRWDRGRNIFLGKPLRAAIAARYALCFERDTAFVYAPRPVAGAVPPSACPPNGASGERAR